ncbi:MAG: DinB family protein [Candidatus Hodarchaeota archaeon]
MNRKNAVQMMIWELERGFQRLIHALNEIPKEEAQWRLTPHSRTLEIIKQWNEKGNEWVSAQTLDPISTIEYKVVHIAQCKQMYDEYAFREGALNWNDLKSPEWPNCIAYLKQTQTRLIDSIQNLSDGQLEQLVSTNWGELWPIKQIISTMIFHDAYHFGQINTIRNLYKLMNRDNLNL